jgi:hypothetical protein
MAYKSQLPYLRTRALDENPSLTNVEFWEDWLKAVKAVDQNVKNQDSTEDQKQYLAEREVFKTMCKSFSYCRANNR